MQAAIVCFTGQLPLKGRAKSLVPRTLPRPHRTVLTFPMAAAAAAAAESSPVVDYSSPTSVFPAEACETIGGEACDAEMFPEVKPTAAAAAAAAAAATSPSMGSEEVVDREYIEYNEPKTVFPGEACDDLGGEFCEPEYQKGVHQEKASSR